MSELISQFRKVCTICSFIGIKDETLCDATKLGVDLLTLAKFKYLLPNEVFFDYTDTPAETVFGDAPDLILVFQFNDKKARSRSLAQLNPVIIGRINRFEAALQKFLSSGHTIDQLDELSKPLIPKSIAEEEQQEQEAKSGDLKIEAKNHYNITDRTGLFGQVCSELNNIVAEYEVPAKEARYGPVPPSLRDSIGDVQELWSHQSMGLEHLLASNNHHLVVSTPTASGKSLIFHSLVHNSLHTNDEATAMFIYPTKALAQDQLRSFMGLGNDYGIYTFDGDTDFEKRKTAQRSARVLLVNPDILHTTILPNWSDWCRFLSSLRYVVIDELHYYGGIFGANVALVIRRLRRICEQLGAEPCQYIGCSATLNHPKEFMATITGLTLESILALTEKDDGSPSGNKKFIFCTPNYMTPEDPTSGRYHPIQEAAPLMTKMVRAGMRVIAFCRYRKECELLLRAIYESDKSMMQAIKGYRGGYSPEDRREIENLMFNGQLRGIVATSALEVGIDIGNLDAAIISGFPYSIASFRQQIGRVGRRQHDSLVVYVADGSVLNQAYAKDPARVINGDMSDVPVVLHDSLVRSHIQASAYELSIEPNEIKQFFPRCDNLAAAELIDMENGTLSFPFKPSINLRKSEDEKEDTLVIDGQSNKVIETVEYQRVGFTLYEGAIFIHQGKSYLVIHLDPDLVYAKVQRTHAKWTTRQRDYTDVDPLETKAIQQISPKCQVIQSSILVTTKVFGYFKVDEHNKIIDSVDVQIPPNVSVKYGFYINLAPFILETLKERKHHIAASIHAAEHVIISTMPMFVSMAPGDVATECKAPEKEILAKRETQRHRPARLIFYEKYGGKQGAGILLSAYRQFGPLIQRACELLDACPCELGCDACISSTYCVEKNAVLSKMGAQVILRLLLEHNLEGVPLGPEPNLPTQKITTVVPTGAPVFGNKRTIHHEDTSQADGYEHIAGHEMTRNKNSSKRIKSE